MSLTCENCGVEVDDNVRLRRERDDALARCRTSAEDRQKLSRELEDARTELAEVTMGRDEALEKVDILIANARSDEHEIDRITAALLNLIDSVTATKTRDAIVLRDIEASRALLGEVRS